ncbi:MAG: type I-C CRISPR-associated endonuclease Cas1 [Candidatus Wallbacteria bacterium]|nr:type I-C CRISPR-associated endonuclease Cas1 [Candidatus Wallbacteria bacterium]
MTNVHNVLYITTQGAWLRKDHETVLVRVERQNRLAIPLHHLEGIVCFGRVNVTPNLLGACATRGISLSFLTETGRFLGRVEGPVSGNVLLRRSQYRRADDAEASARLAKSFLLGKLGNARVLLLRSAREQAEPSDGPLGRAAARISEHLRELGLAEGLDSIRGVEGRAAATYFGVFDRLIRRQKEDFSFSGRTRRPPRDPMNALLSFLYALLRRDAESALGAVGLDPQVGYLHVDRPGRPSLGLDLMEELRPALADRLAVGLVNLAQVKARGFDASATGAVSMNEATRKEVLVAYQKRKQESLRHPFTDSTIPLSLVVHVQARLLARVIRGDLADYPPFVSR